MNYLTEKMYLETSKEIHKIDFIISKMKENKNIPKKMELFLPKLESILMNIFNVHCKIKILYKTDELILRVFPSKEEIEGYALKVLESNNRIKFEKCNNVVIEISHEFLMNKNIKSQEITAGLLHEIGHLVYRQNTISYFEEFLYKFRGPVSFLERFLPKIFLLPIFIIVALYGFLIAYEYRLRGLSNKREYDADSFAIKHGYGIHLDSLLSKIIQTVQKNANIKRDKSYTYYTMIMLDHITNRRIEILNRLETEFKESEDSYAREILKDQINRLKKQV